MSSSEQGSNAESLRDLVIARYGTLSEWGRVLGVSAYKARQWANDRDGTVTDEQDRAMAESLGMCETEFFQRFRTNRYYVGRHVFTLTSHQLAILLNLAVTVGERGTRASQVELETQQFIAREAGEYARAGEPWLADDAMRDFLKWWALSIDMQRRPDDEEARQ